MTKQKASSKRVGAGGGRAEADPRFEPVARVFARVPGFSLMESKSQGSRGLMLNGKSFGMSHHGRFVLKLDEKLAAFHVAAGTAKPFYAAPNRPMKGWIEVSDPKADWVKLAKEAYRLASGSIDDGDSPTGGPAATARSRLTAVATRRAMGSRKRSQKTPTPPAAPASRKMSKGSR
jgi:hypothetical protein